MSEGINITGLLKHQTDNCIYTGMTFFRMHLSQTVFILTGPSNVLILNPASQCRAAFADFFVEDTPHQIL